MPCLDSKIYLPVDSVAISLEEFQLGIKEHLTDFKVDSLKQSLESILRQREGFEESFLEVLNQAYEINQRFHGYKIRHEGLPYMAHYIETAIYAALLGHDLTTVVATLLHDSVDNLKPEDLEKNEVSKEDVYAEINDKFGKDVEYIVEAVTDESPDLPVKRLDKQKIFEDAVIKAYNDPRVLIVKGCDRLSNLRSLEGYAANKGNLPAARILHQTHHYYIPLIDILDGTLGHALQIQVDELSERFPFRWGSTTMELFYEMAFDFSKLGQPVPVGKTERDLIDNKPLINSALAAQKRGLGDPPDKKRILDHMDVFMNDMAFLYSPHYMPKEDNLIKKLSSFPNLNINAIIDPGNYMYAYRKDLSVPEIVADTYRNKLLVYFMERLNELWFPQFSSENFTQEEKFYFPLTPMESNLGLESQHILLENNIIGFAALKHLSRLIGDVNHEPIGMSKYDQLNVGFYHFQYSVPDQRDIETAINNLLTTYGIPYTILHKEKTAHKDVFVRVIFSHLDYPTQLTTEHGEFVLIKPPGKLQKEREDYPYLIVDFFMPNNGPV